MASEVARLFITIDSKGTGDVSRDLNKVDKGLKSTSKSADNAKKTFQGLGNVAKTAGLALGGALAFGAKKAIDEYRDAEKVGRQTNAVIKSTGGAANVSAKQVEALANKLSLKSGKDDEAIQKGANLLLTFKGIRNEAGKGNDVFNQTVAVTNDMASAMGMDMKQAALQVGKALNDPAAGLGKLQRVGVTFTEGQKKQIAALQASGKTMEAQKIILGELNSEFAGSAAANADPFDKLKVAVDNLFETIGRSFAPALAEAAGVLATFVGQMETGQGSGGAFVKMLENGWAALQPLVEGVKSAVAAFMGLDTNMKLVVASLAGFGALAAVVLLPISAPLVAVVAGVAALAAAAILIRKNWGTIGPVFDAVSQAVSQFVGGLKGSLSISSDDLNSFRQAVQNVGTAVGWVFQNYMLPLIQRVLPAISQIIQGWVSIVSGIVKVFSGILTGDFGEAWEGVKQIFSGALNVILGTLRAITAPFRQLIVTLANLIKAPFVSAWDAVKGVFSAGLNFGLSYIRSVTGAYRSAGAAIGSGIVSGFNAIKDIPGNAKKVFDSAFDFLNGLPAKFLEFGKRMGSALVRPLSGVGDVIRGLATSVSNAVKTVINSGLSVINFVIGKINSLPSVKTPFGSIGFPNLGYIPYAAAGMKTNGATLAMIGEGAAPEYVIPTEPRYRSNALDLMASAASDLGIPGYKSGKGKKKTTAEDRKKTTLSDSTSADYQRTSALSALTPSNADDIRVAQDRIKTLSGMNELRARGFFASIGTSASRKFSFPKGSVIQNLIDDRGKYKKGTVGYTNFDRLIAGAYSEIKGLFDQLDELRKPPDTPPTLPDTGSVTTGGLDSGSVTDPSLSTGSVGDPGLGTGGGPIDTGPTPDQTAILNQANQRASIAQRASDLSAAFIRAAFSSGDIGSGNFGNAFGAAAGITINTLHPGDPRTLQAIAQAAAAGWGLSSFTPSSLAPTGL